MTCDFVQGRLNDYVDGDLAAAEVHAVELHLATCAACREEEKALRSLLGLAAALPKVARPERDLWPGIAEEIAKPRRVLAFPARTAVWGGLAAAAALLIAILAGRGPGEAVPGGAMAPGSASPSLVAASPEADLREAEGDYERAIQALVAALEANRDRLAPETLRSVEQNLGVIDEAVREVRAALDKEPGNPELTRMLAATKRKKVDVLQRVVKLSTSRL
jgi:anti-sigma factor RsiW